jgi:hypothetical protein
VGAAASGWPAGVGGSGWVGTTGCGGAGAEPAAFAAADCSTLAPATVATSAVSETALAASSADERIPVARPKPFTALGDVSNVSKQTYSAQSNAAGTPSLALDLSIEEDLRLGLVVGGENRLAVLAATRSIAAPGTNMSARLMTSRSFSHHGRLL